jgi:TP53 regulating kinase-like protein
VRAILKARKLGILTPAVYFAEPEASTIYMEKLDAKMVKDLLLPGALSPEGETCRLVGSRTDRSANPRS